MNIIDKGIADRQIPRQGLQKRIFKIDKDAIDLFFGTLIMAKLYMNL